MVNPRIEFAIFAASLREATMRTTGTLFICLAAATFLVGCRLFDREEPSPALIFIPELSFSTDYATQGTASEDISEVWVYANDRMMGAYELPATVPVLEEGETRIEIFAGVKLAGNPGARESYPFYTRHLIFPNLQPLKVDTVVPSFEYVENATILLVDDFESANVFGLDVNTQGTVDRTDDPELVFEGGRSLMVTIGSDEGRCTIITNEQEYPLPQNRICYLELDYRSNNSFAIGLEATFPGSVQREFISVIVPRADQINTWQKLYIDLSAVTVLFDNATFELVIESVRDSGNSTATLLFDNIKMIHF